MSVVNFTYLFNIQHLESFYFLSNRLFFYFLASQTHYRLDFRVKIGYNNTRLEAQTQQTEGVIE